MQLDSPFKEFLTSVRLTESQRDDAKTGHTTLRNRLHDDAELAPVIISTFLQGSYKRSTAVRPQGGRRADVDVVVVTGLAESQYTPAAAMDLFKPFLDRHYKGKWQQQGRSFGIELSYVDLDLVVTSAPSEQDKDLLRSAAVALSDDLEDVPEIRLSAAWVPPGERWKLSAVQLSDATNASDWRSEPLRIPDREAGRWEDTHPLEQLRWTRDKNGKAKTKGHFVNVVKALKWWRLVNYPTLVHPKGFPLERIIGECCPDGIESVAEGITETLEAIVARYESYADSSEKPFLPDYGVPSHDVLHRLSVDDFSKFVEQAREGADVARRALDSANRKESHDLWRQLLGTQFPAAPEGADDRSGGFVTPSKAANPSTGRFG